MTDSWRIYRQAAHTEARALRLLQRAETDGTRFPRLHRHGITVAPLDLDDVLTEHRRWLRNSHRSAQYRAKKRDGRAA